MKPILFTISGFTVYGYGLMLALALIGSLLFAQFHARRLGLDKEFAFNVGLSAIVVGILGAKLLYLITIADQLSADFWNTLKNSITEGFVVYGGVILAVIYSVFYCHHHKKPFITYFDMAVAVIALGQGIGRIGCFLAGCCYGIPTDAWYGITFPEGSHAPSGVSLFPVQPVSAVLNFINVAVLCYAVRKFKYKGQTAGLYMINYGIGRFLIEFVRNDYRGEVGIFSTSQFISLFVTLLGIAFMVLAPKVFKENRKPAEGAVTPAAAAEAAEPDVSEKEDPGEAEATEVTETTEDTAVSGEGEVLEEKSED